MLEAVWFVIIPMLSKSMGRRKVCREFVVFVEDAEGTGRNIESIVQQLNFNIQGLKKRYSFFGSSIGVYVADTVCSFEKYYAEADKALYETKKKGKDHFTIRKG